MTIANSKLFVLTGGPGAGKTTILRELAKLGYPHAPEVARQIIQEQVAAGGAALPWGDRETYTELMLQRSIASFLEHTPAPSITFSDRGIPDTLGYARLIGLPDKEAVDVCREYRYAPLVFVAPFWPEIYRTDTERKQDLDEAERSSAAVERVYRECGYETVEVPRTDPQGRADFILQRLSRLS